ncbi:MAG TPA: STAS/SEC14 domain-containing protein [Sphingomicrobium sp.]
MIEIQIKGFWTLEHVREFADDARAAARKVLQAGKRQTILYDYTDASIQSSEVVAELQCLAQEKAFRSRKVALYTGRALAKRQASRIADLGHAMRTFDDRDEALAWLKST